MIAHIFGIVAEKFLGSIIIDVGGVGYEVSVASGDFDKVTLGQEVKFYTHHHIREQSQELFGFSSLAARTGSLRRRGRCAGPGTAAG